jgi:hypothetical protein
VTWAFAGSAAEAAAGRPGVGDTLADLLRELQARRLAPADDVEVRHQASQALLDAFRTGGSLVQPAEAAPAQTPALPPLLSATEAPGGRFGYLRIRAVEPGLSAALLEAQARLPTAASGGTVVDLRDAGGNGMGAAAECAALLGATEQPLVLIVNGTTRGAAESMAAQLRDAHGAVLLGEATRGLPYAMCPVRLAGNVEVLLPEVPAGIRPEPMLPDVPSTGKPAAAVAVRSWQGRSEDRDDCVRQAIDLLTAICAFREKHF